MSRPDLTDDELDQRVRAAAAALAAVAPDRGDALAAKVLAELAQLDRASLAVESRMTSDTEPKTGSTAVSPPAARSEDSGLHDIKALASDTRKRISRRTTSQHDIMPEDMLSTSGSLRAVALPEPAMVVALPDAPSTMDDVRAAVAADPKLAAAIAAAPVARRKTGLWVGAGAAAIAAAAAAAIVASGGGHKSDGGEKSKPRAAGAGSSPTALAENRANEMKTPTVTVADPAVTGAGAPAQVAAVAPPPAEPPAAATAMVDVDDNGRAVRIENPARAGAGSDKPAAGSGKEAVRGAGGGSGGSTPKNTGDGKATPGGGAATGAGSGKPAGGGNDGEKSIEDLLNDASGGGGKPKDTGGGGGGGDAPKGPEKTKLEPAEIKAGMSAVAGAAQGCFDKHGVAGHVKVKAVVSPSGSVTKVDATGEFAGTPTGGCVASAVKGASFPAWTGAPMTVTYSFTLQE